MKVDRANVRHILARISIATVFIGIGAWEIILPAQWSFYVPKSLTIIASANILTMAQGVALLVIGAAVLVGAYLKIAAVLASLMLLAIIGDLLVSFGFNDIVLRDLAIFFIALSLCFDDTDYLRLKK